MINLETPTTVYLKDYAVPPFLIPQVRLDIDLLSEDNAWVRATLAVERNAQFPNRTAPLQLLSSLHRTIQCLEGQATTNLQSSPK